MCDLCVRLIFTDELQNAEKYRTRMWGVLHTQLPCFFNPIQDQKQWKDDLKKSFLPSIKDNLLT